MNGPEPRPAVEQDADVLIGRRGDRELVPVSRLVYRLGRDGITDGQRGADVLGSGVDRSHREAIETALCQSAGTSGDVECVPAGAGELHARGLVIFQGGPCRGATTEKEQVRVRTRRWRDRCLKPPARGGDEVSGNGHATGECERVPALSQ